MEARERIFNMPCVISVSRETGKVIGVERGLVRESDVLRICGDREAGRILLQIRNNELIRKREEGQKTWAEATV